MADALGSYGRIHEQRFQLLVNAVTDYALYMLETDGTIASWNPGAHRLKGYEAEEVLGKSYSIFFTDKDRAAGLPGRALEVAAREGRYEAEGIRIRKDGTRFMVNAVIDPIRDEDGQLIGFAKITRDVTERHRAQQELDEARASLAQAQKLQAIGELTGGIAHDFNNLMTVIRGSAELLRSAILTEEKKGRYLDTILATVERASDLTNHLLAFARRQALKPETIDLNIQLDAFVDMLSRTIGSQIEVRLELAPDLWPIEADATQLETALLNAAINARDAMPEGGRLTIATANVAGQGHVADMVCISLTDTGEGMPPDVLERVFDPFFTTKPIGKGTGLGLSQVHGFAAQSGGRAEIESEQGRGTILRIYMPRGQDAKAGLNEEKGLLASGTGATVLLVEDNLQVREFAEALLSELNYRVICASSGEEAIEALTRDKVDLIFSDVLMPGMSGIELARHVRERHPELPILLASGYSDEVVRGGARNFPTLAKPYGAQTLGAAIAAALEPQADRS